jgi:RND family efflux transporter MFP subunit
MKQKKRHITGLYMHLYIPNNFREIFNFEVFMLKKTLCSILLKNKDGREAKFCAISFLALLTISCAGSKDPGEAAASMERLYAEQGRPVTVRCLEVEDFSVYLKYPTVVYASSESTAYASLNDVVRKIYAKVGDTVEQDEIIVSFSADNQSLRQAALAHENAFSAFKRIGALFENNDIARQEYDSVRTQYEIARANLKAADDMVYVKTPIAGTITRINVRPTENVRPGTPLFTISGRNGYEARFYVSAAEIDRIQAGARAFIKDPSRNIEGRVTQISLAMDSRTQAFPVSAFFGTTSGKLVSGMGVDISVETYRNEKAIVLSRSELIETAEGLTAFVAVENTARQVAVQTGHEQGLLLEISGGLEEGNLLVSGGVQNLAPDTKINIVAEADLLAAAGGR